MIKTLDCRRRHDKEFVCLLLVFVKGPFVDDHVGHVLRFHFGSQISQSEWAWLIIFPPFVICVWFTFTRCQEYIFEANPLATPRTHTLMRVKCPLKTPPEGEEIILDWPTLSVKALWLIFDYHFWKNAGAHKFTRFPRDLFSVNKPFKAQLFLTVLCFGWFSHLSGAKETSLMRQLSCASGSLVWITCGDFVVVVVVFICLFLFVFVSVVLSCFHETYIIKFY